MDKINLGKQEKIKLLRTYDKVLKNSKMKEKESHYKAQRKNIFMKIIFIYQEKISVNC